MEIRIVNLSKLPPEIVIYGDVAWRGVCPAETLEQMTFFSWLRREHPTLGAIAIHPRNEGGRTWQAAQREKAEGMTPGASDVIIPAARSFVCEIKRQDHTKSAWQDRQIEYLVAAHHAGAFACVALGWAGAVHAFGAWRDAV